MNSERVPSSRTLTPPPETSGPNDVEAKKQASTVGVAEKEAGTKPPQGFTFPDGGWKAWSTVAGAWLVLFASFGYVNAFGQCFQRLLR